MLTRNFAALKQIENTGDGGTFYDITGSSKYCVFNGAYLAQYRTFVVGDLRYAKCAKISANGVYFGSGTTPATANDNTLEKPITTGLKISLPSNVLRTHGDCTTIYSATYTISNNTDSDITISEIGLFTKLTNGSGSGEFYTMMDRTVLNDPIVIAAGEVKVLTYQLRFGTIYA